MKYQLEDILGRLGLQLSGSKTVRVDRIVAHFETAAPSQPVVAFHSETMNETNVVAESVSPEVAANRFAFRQKSSNPQASLQPWLDNLLNANGLLRCYATEDSNPTKQLKNKLAQAASARGGILVLLLADESAYLKAREALTDRWASNAEWSKSVSCVALAYPIGEPTIHVLVESAANAWSTAVRQRLFPDVEIIRISLAAEQLCPSCKELLPQTARFCPACGTPLAIASHAEQQ